MRKEKIMRFFLAAVLAISMLAMPLTTAYAESVSSSSDAAPSSAVSSSTGTESFPDASSSSGAASSPDVSSSSRRRPPQTFRPPPGRRSPPDVSFSSGAASSPERFVLLRGGVLSGRFVLLWGGVLFRRFVFLRDGVFGCLIFFRFCGYSQRRNGGRYCKPGAGKGNDAFTLEMEGAGTDLDPATKDTTIREKRRASSTA